MAQQTFASLTNPSLVNLDANFTELYGFAQNLRSLSGGYAAVGTNTAGAGAGFACAWTVDSTVDCAMFKTSAGASGASAWMWNSAASGNNLFVAFASESSYVVRGSINYNRGAGLVAYNTTSDYRAKDVLGPVEDSGGVIDAMQVHLARMHGATIARPMFVAHELAAVVPYAVTGEKDAVDEAGAPVLQQVDASSVVPLLVKELQSLRARVAALEATA